MSRSLAALLALSFAVAPLPAVRAAGRAPGARGADPEAVLRREAVAALARDRQGPRGIVALAELGALEGEAPELAHLAAAYAAAIADRATHPEVRALARQRLAALERSRGNFQRSAAQVRRLGFVTRWHVVGPFDDEGKRGFETAYAPEHGIDLAARHDGKAGEVAWRPLPDEAIVHGFVDVGAAMPAREVVAYALALVEAPRDERVALWLGASGAAKVWVNGALALADGGYHPARLDQRGARVTLRRGTNRILVKLCHQGGRMGFFLRLADERGVARAYAAGSPDAPPPAAGPAPAPLEGAVARLEALARAARTPAAEAAARRDLAVALAERQSTDFQERRPAAEARRAAELAPRSVELQLLAASLEEDHARRRRHVEAALAARPGDPRALAALAREELDQGRPHAALRLLDRAAAAAPRWAGPRVSRAEALDRAGLEVRAVRAALDAAEAFPTTPGAVRAAARAAGRLNRVAEAIARLRTLLALRLDDAEGRGMLAHLLVERGEVGAAAALLEEGLRLDPADGEQRLRLADLLAANGRAEEAEAAYADALRIAPDHADALERRGRARLAAGRPRDGLVDLHAALELRPQSPELRELVRSLEPARERFEAPYVLDARALAAEAPPPRADDDAIVLGELKVTRVFPSGLSATFHQLVVKIVNARGADAFRRHVIGWAPDRQDARVERVRIVRPDGTTVETHDATERSTSEPWYRLYFDTRTRTLSFPALAAGDVLEVAWRIEDTSGENLLSDYFGDLTFLDDTTRKARVDYVLLVPQARPIYSNAPDGVRHDTRKLPGGLIEHRFAARDLRRVEPEPGMPGWSEIARYVHVSTYGDWDQVARFYWDLVKDQLRPTDEVRATAARIVDAALGASGAPRVTPVSARAARAGTEPPQGGWTPEQKRAIVRGVYDFVVSQTRYVGLEFGIHGYKPYRVDEVLARRFGDCKDKASLVHALLAASGIDSRLVLLRMRRLGRMPETPASLAVFNHAIVYVPELDLWLDGTAAHSGSGDLPSEDRGATVLVVNPGGEARFGTIPQALPEDNRVESRFEVTLTPDGRAQVRGSSRVRGSQAPQYRRAYLAEHERRAQLERAFGRTFPGAEVTGLSVSDLTRIEEDVAMEFTLDVPRYALADRGGLRFTPFGDAAGYAESYASLSARRYDLVAGEPGVTRFTYRYLLPQGWAPVEVPERSAADTPHGAFEVRYRREPGALVAEGHVTFKTARIAAAEYPAFRELAARIDRAFSRKVRIAPAAGGEGSR